jgi:SEC-C motif-containing protein
MSLCYCGSGKSLADCCGPILEGTRAAGTAEQLMRSRYSAYAVADNRYLLASHHRSTRPKSMDVGHGPAWCGLTIVDVQGGDLSDDRGIVEFKALYRDGGIVKILHERSRFVRESGCWYYVDGDQLQPGSDQLKKVGRNALCSCGSGRKFKRCCLKKE